jgi:hypothetical protein
MLMITIKINLLILLLWIIIKILKFIFLQLK